MQLRLLPSYFKKVGLGLFLLTVWPSFFRGFIDGYNSGAESEQMFGFEPFHFLGIPFFSDAFFEICSILALIGLIIYAASRDETFDEFMQRLRMEAMRLTFFISIIFVFFLLIMDITSNFSALYLVELQVIIFLVVKKLKKWNADPVVGTYE